MKAIIIDDELEICMLLTATLKGYGIKAFFALTLAEGYAKIDHENPLLVFLDINLPDGSGLDGLEHIVKKHPHTKVVMISAYDTDKERNVAKNNGAYDFIGKPFSAEKVYKIVDTLL